MLSLPGPCKYEMHDDKLGWEAVQTEWDALSEQEKARYMASAVPCRHWL